MCCRTERALPLIGASAAQCARRRAPALPEAATLSQAACAPTSFNAQQLVIPPDRVSTIDGMRANDRRMVKRRPRNPTRFTGTSYAQARIGSFVKKHTDGTECHPPTTTICVAS